MQNTHKMKRGKDYIGVGVGAMVFNEKAEVLIAKRGPASNNEVGLWDFPGGTVEFGESIEDTVIREFKEEVDIEIELVELLNVVNHILPEEGQHWVSPVYIAKHIGGIPKVLEPEKCPEIEWVKVEDLNPEILTKSSRASYYAYLEKYPV
jgi:8-oxo-dGTP diphosphatase